MHGLHFAHQGNGALNASSGRSLSPQTTLKKDGANDAEEHLHLQKTIQLSETDTFEKANLSENNTVEKHLGKQKIMESRNHVLI